MMGLLESLHQQGSADELLIPKSEGVYSFLMSFMSAAKPPKSAGGSSPYG